MVVDGGEITESPRRTNAKGEIEIYKFGTEEVLLTLSREDYFRGFEEFKNSVIGLITSSGIKIESVNKHHPYERMLERGFQLNDVIEALKTSKAVPATGHDTWSYPKGQMQVIVNHSLKQLKTVMGPRT